MLQFVSEYGILVDFSCRDRVSVFWHLKQLHRCVLTFCRSQPKQNAAYPGQYAIAPNLDKKWLGIRTWDLQKIFPALKSIYAKQRNNVTNHQRPPWCRRFFYKNYLYWQDMIWETRAGFAPSWRGASWSLKRVRRPRLKTKTSSAIYPPWVGSSSVGFQGRITRFDGKFECPKKKNYGKISEKIFVHQKWLRKMIRKMIDHIQIIQLIW